MLLDGYIRVSQVGTRGGERFISPAVQREQIVDWIELHGATVGEIFEELDESGARRDRPLLMEALGRVESGTSNGLVVAKLDRFGRSLSDSLAAIDRLQTVGGTFVSVQDGLDLNTPTGKLVLRIMFSMAEWELDRIRSSWETAKLKAIERGVHVGAWCPFGYRRGSDGRLRPHRSRAAVVTELFRRRAAGTSMTELGRWLERRGIRTTHGNRGWSATSIRHILSNRVYLGELRSGVHVQTDVHVPLVDPVTWHQAQNPRSIPERSAGRPTLLGGLLRCAGCSMALRSQTYKRTGSELSSAYSCQRRSAAGECPSPAYVAGTAIEPYIERALFSRLSARRSGKQPSTRAFALLEKRVASAERALAAYRDDGQLQLILGSRDFHLGLEARVKARDEAVAGLAAETRRRESIGLPSARDMEEAWPEMTIQDRRAAIASVIDCVFVWRGKGDIPGRTHICYSGQAPSDLPRTGHKRARARTIDRGELRPEPAIRNPGRWTKARIQAELEGFLASDNAWPSAETFYRDGRGPLYTRILRTGGPSFWARRVGVTSPRGRVGVSEWIYDDAVASLADFVRGRAQFPSRREFGRAGYSSLFGWLQRNGGLDYWAKQFGLPRPKAGPNPVRSVSTP